MKRKARAFSLLEVMVAMAIFGVGLSAVFSSFQTIRRVYSAQRDLATAQGIGQRFAEQMYVLPKDNGYITAAAEHQNDFNYDVTGRAVGSMPGARYHINYTVEEDVPYPGVNKVSAVVRWTDDVRDHQFPLEIYVN